MIEIISYEEKYQSDFKRINLEWLDKYNLTESHDLVIMDDPIGKVIAPGGCIFLALHNNEVIGSAGLWKENEDAYELVKMTVVPEWRGRGVSKLLVEKCINEARKKKAQKIILFSNSQLQTAISLYKKYGFQQVPVTDAPFLTADVKMELSL